MTLDAEHLFLVVGYAQLYQRGSAASGAPIGPTGDAAIAAALTALESRNGQSAKQERKPLTFPKFTGIREGR